MVCSIPRLSLPTLFLAGIQSLSAILGLLGIIFRPETTGWIALVILFCSGITPVIGLAALDMAPPARRLIPPILERRWPSRIIILLLFLFPVVGLGILPTYLYNTPSMRFYLPFVLIWPVCTLLLLLKVGDGAAAYRVRPFAGKLAGVGISILLGVVMFELILQVVFVRLPWDIKHLLPYAAPRHGIRYDTAHGAREYPPGQQVSYLINEQFGDLFVVTCLRQPDPAAPAPVMVEYVRDEHGFRNPSPWPEKIDLAVVGDSFVAAEPTQTPFWKQITANTLAFGVAAIGNMEEGLLIDTYALPRSPQVVVMTYFEGNDLIDNFTFHKARSQGDTLPGYATKQMMMSRPLELLVTTHTVRWLGNSVNTQQADCDFPVEDAYGHHLVFFRDYLGVATVDAAKLRASEAFSLTQEALLDISARVKASGAEFVLAYIPQKAHVHWPGIVQAEIVDVMGRHASAVEFDDETGYRFNPELSAEVRARLLMENMDTQRDLIAELAEENDILFLDFTPSFQAGTAAGESYYFYADSHWNQAGHDLARRVLRDFLSEHQLLPPEALLGVA